MMLTKIALLILVLAGIGALFLGGDSFGDSVRKGCGCRGVLILLILLLVLSLFWGQ